MIPYKAIIVDDDVVITRRIKQLIEQNGEFKVVAEANSAHSFLQLFPLQNYDLVILDIDLPDGSGIELAKWIRKSDQRVPLLFITGYADYGVESYQVEATDYILKPIRPEFVQLALDKVKRHLNQVDSSLQLIKKTLISQGKISLKQDQGLVFLETDTIILIQKEGKKTALLTLENEGGKWKTQTYYTNENLKDLYKRLDPYSFIRSHQSFIVNLKWIHEISRYTSESYKIKFKHTEEFALLNRDKLNILMQKIQ